MKDIESKEVEILSEELLESEIKDSTKEEKQKKNKTKSKKEKKVKVKKVKEKKQKENDGNVLKKIGIILLILGLMCVAIGTSIFFITEHSSNKPTKEPPKVEEPKKEAEPKEEKTSFSFIAVGDALIHDGIYYDANTWQTDQDGYYIYDFALPMVLLYSLYSGKSDRLASWLRKCPMKQFTTLDTHDGIGVVDAKDVLTDDELEYTTNELYKVGAKKLYQIGANVKKKYSSAEYHNLDIYQINTTYYSALGNDDKKYFLARLLQVFAPGIPQIYYVGLLAGKNDLKLLEETKEGRNINRHYYSKEEIAEEVKRPVVQSLIKLLKFRNEEAAFDLDGSIEVETPSENEIVITRMNREKTHKVTANINLKNLNYSINANGKKINFNIKKELNV